MLSQAEIAARIAAFSGGGGTSDAAPAARRHYVTSMRQAADDLIELFENQEDQFLFHVPELDSKIRGIGPGQLAFVTGRTHSGKTQLTLQGIINNPEKPTVIFSSDEVPDLIMAKMYSIATGANVEEVEYLVRQGDNRVSEDVRRVAAEQFSNVMVVTEALSFAQMTDALNEAQDAWGAKCKNIIYDYLELHPEFEGEAHQLGRLSVKMRDWTQQMEVSPIVLHQAGKTSVERGWSGGSDAMRGAPDGPAMFVIEVYRKRDRKLSKTWTEADAHEHRNTVTVNVAKNKIPPSRVGEMDLFLDPDCGRIRPLRDSDRLTRQVVMSEQDSPEVVAARWLNSRGLS
jgi:replicative DNA helicase